MILNKGETNYNVKVAWCSHQLIAFALKFLIINQKIYK